MAQGHGESAIQLPKIGLHRKFLDTHRIVDMQAGKLVVVLAQLTPALTAIVYILQEASTLQ